MKFTEYPYTRPNLDDITTKFNELLVSFKEANGFVELKENFNKIIDVFNNFETLATVVSVRNSIDTTDEFYKAEQDFMDESYPKIMALSTELYKAVLDSEFLSDIEAEYGKQFVDIARVSIKTFDEVIMDDLAKEAKLSTEYSALIASAKIDFDGKVRNLSEMRAYSEHANRNTRKEAAEKVAEFFEENDAEFGRIYDELVKVRHTMATKLGYDNYVELGYLKMLRTEYTAVEVKNYRDQVYTEIVPVVNKIREAQEKRIGVDKLKFHDEKYNFTTGNAAPHGTYAEIIASATKMYDEMSPETSEFFNMMVNDELLDLTTKPGKRGGGYCTIFSDYKKPFIFANFNGTSGDIDVLTHEVGHAFQTYMSRNYDLPEYHFPTYEACEIHSMSMEFFAWPWMELFFTDADKYRYSHLSSALTFIPYGVTVDEFQHFVYENPEASIEERKQAWSEIEKKYSPYRDYDGIDYLAKGAFWYRQGHIFSMPFYYIDYTLAQVCALQFFKKSLENKEQAWEDYVRLCKAGGSQSFLNLVELANLKNPFKDGTINSTIKPVLEYLDSVDDSKF